MNHGVPSSSTTVVYMTNSLISKDMGVHSVTPSSSPPATHILPQLYLVLWVFESYLLLKCFLQEVEWLQVIHTVAHEWELSVDSERNINAHPQPGKK